MPFWADCRLALWYAPAFLLPLAVHAAAKSTHIALPWTAAAAKYTRLYTDRGLMPGPQEGGWEGEDSS